ncbi:MAG: hypothetical protein Ta2D_09640 [Rickettsiales bacterium]|nr:MAG: hypothetical protein Ta2D_09640 [Rickettsiales bacterium]
MHNNVLDEVVNDFYDGQFNVLIATTIVESGLDIPDVNTIIVYRANMFGLSQLHQLRGRVGRGKVKGYAYLYINPVEIISENAVKRLDAIQQNQEIGSGFAIASSDMDIRGSGNLVGEEQSGHIREIGVELYNQMLVEEINRAKSEFKTEFYDFSTEVNFGVPTNISNYIEEKGERLYYYRKINNLREAIFDELKKKYGEIPQEIYNLIEIKKIKDLCRQKKITKLSFDDGILNITFYENTYKNPDLLIKFVKEKKAKFTKNDVIGFFIDSEKIFDECYRILQLL